MFTRRRVHRILCSLLIVGCGNPFPFFAQQPQDLTLTPVANLFVGVFARLCA